MNIRELLGRIEGLKKDLEYAKNLSEKWKPQEERFPIIYEYILKQMSAFEEVIEDSFKLDVKDVASLLEKSSSPAAQVSEEEAAEMADLFLRRERISWVLAAGNFNGSMYLSLRTIKKNARAFRVIQRIVQDNVNAGGHDQFAGGRIDPDNPNAEEMMLLEEEVRDRFADVLGLKKANWKPVVEKL